MVRNYFPWDSRGEAEIKKNVELGKINFVKVYCYMMAVHFCPIGGNINVKLFNRPGVAGKS